jgi:predicted ATPase/tRNA A-37 threonylcarbamoyl transferase component Bud32
MVSDIEVKPTIQGIQDSVHEVLEEAINYLQNEDRNKLCHNHGEVEMNPTILNQRYRLDEELGRGSMGIVYCAHDLLLEREVLVKLLNESRLDEAGKERLLREARAMAKLDHPNIISVHDASEVDGVPFIIMQYFPGKNLHEIGSLPLPQALEIVTQVCRALEHAHSQGIIHRDVKPENVIVAQEDEHWIARLTDFGLARSLASRKTAEGTIVGTVFYMAPEQAMGQSVDARADLYALGVMLYELVSGRLPFEGDDALAVISQHIHAEPTPPGSLNVDITPALEALILRLLSKRPEDRPASAAEVRNALEQMLIKPGQSVSTEKPLHNLPTALSSFIGRAKESAEVKRLLAQTRLLTLSGVGGTGKTRLALHCAAQVLDDFEHGIWLVELARLTDPERILPIISMVFDLYEGKEGIPLEVRLLHHLGDKRLLLILDNCEHLIEAAAQQVESILKAAPQVKVLVTSREALGLDGEKIYLVPALTLPDTSHLPPTDELQHYDAVRLFIERASNALPAFALTEINAAEVAQICQRLDGIPLAIELAAVRVKALATDQILARLDNRFRLLTGGSRTALPRQQTLRATIDWSYALLSPEEQSLLRSLAVFMGGFTLEAAETVCASDGELEVLDGLASLVTKSLVEAELVGGEVYRYRLLETVRQYAQEKLDEAGEATQVRDRHLLFYLEVSKKVEQCFRTLQGGWDFVKSLKDEAANFRSAMGWAYASGIADMVSRGLSLASNLMLYFQRLNLYGEGLAWVKKGLAFLEEDDDKYSLIRAKALFCASELSNNVDNNNDCYRYAWESVNLYRKCEYPDLLYLGSALMTYSENIGFLEPERSHEVNKMEAAALFHEGVTTLQKSGERLSRCIQVAFECNRAIQKNDIEVALRWVDEARVLFQGTDWEVVEYYLLAEISRKQGEFSKSLDNYQKYLYLHRTHENKIGICFALLNMGDCAVELKQMDQAEKYYQESMTIARELGAKWQFSYTLRRLSEISISKGQYQEAVEYLEQGLILAPDMDPDILASNCLIPLLSAAEGIAPADKLVRLLGFLNRIQGINSPNWSEKSKGTLERVMTELQVHLGAGYQVGLDAGCNLSIEQVQAEALAIARQVAETGKA